MLIISIQLCKITFRKRFQQKRTAFYTLPGKPRWQSPFGLLNMAFFHSCLSSTLLFFSLCNTCSCQPPSAPRYRSAPHERGGATSRVCSQHHSSKSHRPTVLPTWRPKRTLPTCLCAMWVLSPTGWLLDRWNVCLWLDSVLSILKWWVHSSNLPATIWGGDPHTTSFSFFWKPQGWGGRHQNTLETYQNCICLCVWNLMPFTREGKQEYHYVLRTKISEKSVSSYWLSSIGRFREKKWNSHTICLQPLNSVWDGFVVDLSVGK